MVPIWSRLATVVIVGEEHEGGSCRHYICLERAANAEKIYLDEGVPLPEGGLSGARVLIYLNKKKNLMGMDLIKEEEEGICFLAHLSGSYGYGHTFHESSWPLEKARSRFGLEPS